MLRQVSQRLILNTVWKPLGNDGKRLKSSKNDQSSSSLCAEAPPPPPPPSPSPVDLPPCPPPPPPCGPPCQPPVCTIEPDPNNPCNYVPPENPDPDEPDMTRVKRLQCQYQREHDTPTFLRGGRKNVYLFHFITIIGGISLINSLYGAYLLVTK